MNDEITAVVRQFFSRYTVQKFTKGQRLIDAYEEPKGIYLLESGYVKQSYVSESHDPVSLHIFRPGSFFPLTWLFHRDASSYIHESMTSGSVFRAPTEDVERFLRTESQVLYDVASRLMAGLSGFRTRLVLLTNSDAYHRTIAFLIYLAATIGKREGNRVRLPVPFPHKDIASWIGTTRETASVQMETLVHHGYISYEHRHIVIHAIDTLQQLMGDVR